MVKGTTKKCWLTRRENWKAFIIIKYMKWRRKDYKAEQILSEKSLNLSILNENSKEWLKLNQKMVVENNLDLKILINTIVKLYFFLNKTWIHKTIFYFNIFCRRFFLWLKWVVTIVNVWWRSRWQWWFRKL